MAVAGLRVSAGKWLSRWLSRPPQSWSGRTAGLFNDKFNLRYLADRLQHERHAVQRYVGDVRQLPTDPGSRISIICRVYGIKFGYIRQLIRSVQRQSYHNWELCICIDGDPRVKVQRFIGRLAKQDPDRYRVTLHPQNRGICAATRSATALATGGIVVFADPDDVLHRDAMAAVAKAFASDPGIDMAYTNNDILTPWSYRIDPVYKPAWSPELLLCCNYIIHLVALRRDLLERCEGLWADQVAGAEDWDMLLRTTRLARGVHHIPIVLYHWRAHADSTSTNARPWTFTAKNNLQQSWLTTLDERLCWGADNDKDPAPIHFREHQAPPLQVVKIYSASPHTTTSFCSEYTYPGNIHVEHVHAVGTLEQQAAALDKVVGEMQPVAALVLFVCADLDDPALHGSIDTQAAFAVLPGVGCVWPFYDQWRGTYTVCEDFLSARLRQTGFFTNWSGNVLTGPLHGLIVRHDVWAKLGGFQALCNDQIPRPQPIQALGALFGLRALQLSLRNVAVRTVTSAWHPPVLELGPLVPGYDPYL